MDNVPWLTLATKYLGQHEILGRKDNQFILDCFKHTSYHAGHDEVPWCAAFICRMLDETKMKSTNSAAANSFASYGEKCDLKPGAILVFKWASGEHHVTMCHHVVDDHYVACLGGNQSDMVKISVYNRVFIQSIRWPVGV